MTTHHLHMLAFKAMPYMVAAILAMGGGMGTLVIYIVDDRTERLEAKLEPLIAQVSDLRVREAFRDAKVEEHDRRLNSRKSPIAEVRSFYGGVR